MATPVESALRRAVADLNALKIQWALVGGLAISVRSVPRFTKDLDFAVAVAGDPELARDYLRVDYLAGLLRAKADAVTIVNGDGGPSGDVVQGEAPVTYLGLAEPPGLPDGSAAYTLGNLSALIPA